MLPIKPCMSAGAARSPAGAVLNLLQQPFDDTRTCVFRWVERCRISRPLPEPVADLEPNLR
jgi:hypothetical protein